MKGYDEMCAKIIYKDNLVSDELLTKQTDELLKYFKECNIFEGDIVAFKSKSYYGTIIQWLACCKARLIPLWIPFDYQDDLIKKIVKGIKIKGLVMTKEDNEHYFFKYEIPEHCDEYSKELIKAGSILQVTSATTGIPKIVIRTKERLDSEIDRYVSKMALTDKDVFLPIVPLCHSFGFVCSFLTALKCNATIVITDSILPRNIIQACNKHNVTILLGVVHFYEKMMGLSDSYKFNKGIRYIISSCGLLDSELKANFEKKFGVCMTQMYGSTETGSLAISSNEDEANFLSIMFEGVEFIVKEDADGIPWIYVKTLETIGSYLKSNPSKNLQEEYIKMGDIGEITKDNRLHILGRGDDVVIVYGKKFSIKTINNVLKKNPDLVDFKLYKNKENGELICEYVSDFEPQLIRQFCRKHLQEYQIPKHFYKVDSIQKNNISWKNRL